MEGHGIGRMFEELKKDGMSVEYSIQDGDASAKKGVKVHKCFFKKLPALL